MLRVLGQKAKSGELQEFLLQVRRPFLTETQRSPTILGMAQTDVQALTEEIKRESQFIDQIVFEMGKVVVGQKTLIERILNALLCEGHVS